MDVNEFCWITIADGCFTKKAFFREGIWRANAPGKMLVFARPRFYAIGVKRTKCKYWSLDVDFMCVECFMVPFDNLISLMYKKLKQRFASSSQNNWKLEVRGIKEFQNVDICRFGKMKNIVNWLFV